MVCYKFLRLKNLKKLKKKIEKRPKGRASMVFLSILHLLYIFSTGPVKARIRFSIETKV